MLFYFHTIKIDYVISIFLDHKCFDKWKNYNLIKYLLKPHQM